MNFKQWLKTKEIKENATGSGDVACFANRLLMPVVNRNVDPFFNKKRNKKK
jgi:hypothetical protein